MYLSAVTALASMDLSCIAHARWLTLWIVWFSFNSISREFFFATTSGLFLWLGVLSFQYLLCFFPNINVFIRSISRLLVFLWGIHAFQSFRIYMKRATFQTNIELNCLLRCQPSGFSFWPCTSLFFCCFARIHFLERYHCLWQQLALDFFEGAGFREVISRQQLHLSYTWSS